MAVLQMVGFELGKRHDFYEWTATNFSIQSGVSRNGGYALDLNGNSFDMQ